MQYSDEQQAAIRAVAEWYQQRSSPVFRLYGYAGTGKTTIAREVQKQLRLRRVIYVAFTGKAAMVLQRRGCPAITLHQLLYLPAGRPDRQLKELEAARQAAEDRGETTEELDARIAAERETLKQPAFSRRDDGQGADAELIVVDEAPMVSERIGRDLLELGVPVLALGDPAQLPPVRGSSYFELADPDSQLTEIHRQAKDSPILQLASMIREGGRPEIGEYGDSRVVGKGTLSLADLAAADQVIVGKNASRRLINQRIRSEHYGRTSPYPEPGDRLICLRNNRDKGLLNGGQWICERVDPPENERLLLTLVDEEDTRRIWVEAHAQIFTGDEVEYWAAGQAEHFDFGYAITAHKAQGSQWQDVVVIDESRVFRGTSDQWLYTAVTRAAERVTIVR